MSWEVLQGDCLELLADMPDGSVDAVVTDPPYIVGGTSIGNANAKAGTWADMENAAHWYASWMRECARVTADDGHLLIFGSWRTLPTLMRAASLCKQSITSCLVWDKMWIGPGGKRGYRPRYEIIAHIAQPEAVIQDRALPDIVSCKWLAGNCKTTEHPAEKPSALVAELIGHVLPDGGGTVLDPFCGSGTTGVAAVPSSSFIGMEREAHYCQIARDRIAAAASKAAHRQPELI